MFFLGKRDWARSHNQVGIVHCLAELFLHFASSQTRADSAQFSVALV